jgi:hypothetical protein
VTDMVCPSCGCEQGAGLLCARETDLLEKALGDVRWIVTELGVTMSKQARLGTPGKGGLARERNPIDLGALESAVHLKDILVGWARDVSSEAWRPTNAEASVVGGLTNSACRLLLTSVPDVRKHPAADELLSEVTEAVEQARRSIDRPADRAYLGQCYTELPGEDGDPVTCYAEIWSRPDASEATCKVCGVTHDVAERRAWLLTRAADMLVTVKEASRYIGDVGGMTVTESSIRGLIHRKRLGYRAETTTFRLGDLLEVLADKREEKAA